MQAHTAVLLLIAALMAACTPKAALPAPSKPADRLPGKTFVVVGLALDADLRYADDAPRQTLTFNADGTLVGSAGCNTYRATYKIEGALLHVQQVVSTRRACPDKEKMQYEAYFLQRLQKSPLTIEDSPTDVALREADGKAVMTLREE
jgi:heat shock protein HslJ